jgi:uncharacterized membrane protein
MLEENWQLKIEVIKMADKKIEPWDVPGIGWRVSLSIVEAMGWLVFLVIWFFFYAQTLQFYQNIAVFAVSVAILGIVEGFTWTPTWWDREIPRFGRAVALQSVVGLITLAFAFVWLFFYADSADLYTNIAIMIIPIAVYGLTQSVGRRWRKVEELRTSVWVAGLIIGLIWAASLFIWFYYYAAGYSLFVNFGVFALSGMILGGLQGVTRAPWRQFKSMEPGLGWRVALSVVMAFGWIAFFVLWFVFLGVGYSAYQTIAVLLISVLILVAVLGAAWAPWGIRQARKASKK